MGEKYGSIFFRFRTVTFRGSPVSELPELSEDDSSEEAESGSNIRVAPNQDQVQQNVNEAVDDSQNGVS